MIFIAKKLFNLQKKHGFLQYYIPFFLENPQT